ncbi:protein delta homolog 2-like [Oscarella lobularis]|uniref:protein delta homolog 2-like n=1 Tax=Oscarella lobularis TaxID=121494 RepID=UPI00331375A7
MLSFSCIVILGFIGTPGRDALTVLPEVPEGPCRVLKIDCEKCRCGKQTCTVIEKCNICRFARAPTKRIAEAGFCSTQTKREVVKQCCEAKCENGATATSVPSIPPELKIDTNLYTAACHYFFPTCLCASGFEGQCCEKRSAPPCETASCPAGTECREERPCPTCPLEAKCVEQVPTPLVPTQSPRCPLKCPPGTMCKLASSKCPVGQFCPLSVQNLEYQCVPDLCGKQCPIGTVCKKMGIVCITAPCPEQFECLPIVVNPCALKLCSAESLCRVRGGTAVCEKIAFVTPPPPPPPPAQLNLCPSGPIFTPAGIVSPCVVECSSHDQCGPSKICCHYGCSVVCRNPLF